MDRHGGFCHIAVMALPIPSRVAGRALGTRALSLALVGVAALAIDVPVARWFKEGVWPTGTPRLLTEVADEVRRLVMMSEVVAHTASVAVILALVLALDPGLAWPSRLVAAWRSRGRSDHSPLPRPQADFARMLAATVAGGITTDLIKLLVDRVRPRALDFATQASAWDSFASGLVATVTGSRSNINSFPSGHSAMAAGLAAALAWRYPRGRWFFAVFAAMAMAQRVVSSAHFPSDTFFGAALGLAGASLFLPERPAVRDADGPTVAAAADGGGGRDSV